MLSIISIGVFLMSAIPGTAALSTTTNFTDVEKYDTYGTAIYYLKTAGIVDGYADGTFKPGAKINRAEFLKILLEAQDYEGAGSNCFTDVTSGKWYVPYVCKAEQLGFVSGYSDGSFKPTQPITFVEASKIISNVMDLDVDETKTENWYQKFVLAMQAQGAIPTTITNTDKKITRSEMAEMVWRIKEKRTNEGTLSYDLLNRVGTAASSKNLRNFTSCTDLQKYIEDNQATHPRYYYDEEADSVALPSTSKAAESTAGAEMGPGGAGDDYSKTNVQVEGVDEADIVKNDGQYIYLISSGTVKIVKASPAAEMKELDEVTFDDDENFYPSELYVDGNTLVVIGTSYSTPDYWTYESKSVVPYYGSVTKIYTFDTSNKNSISLKRHLDFEGNYVSSRKIGDIVYLVSNKYVYSYEPVPYYYDSNTEIAATTVPCGNVWYSPRITESMSYLTVAGIPIEDEDATVSKQVVLGSGSNVYASKSNLYVAENKYSYYWRYDSSNSDEETIVHKFALKNAQVMYKASGSVPGTILNQFSMDENDGYFRIATTLGDVWTTTPPAKNNLYILDGALNKVGSLEGLAPGEKIYSVRFVGDRAYIVTFKKVDPLFVIDTTDPKLPKVLGKLKIPGYSDYLHPYDENHIIGFGKDAVDAGLDETTMRGLDFAWYQGMKIAMFDVTDVNNPKELHKMIIGDRGTESELLWNHKALLFDKAKGFMAFPVTLAEVPDSVKDDPTSPSNTYGDYVYQGAYVFNVSVANGFTLRGRITQYDQNEIKDKAGYYWYGDKDISRIIYIGDNFYTISTTGITANKMSDLSEVNRVELKNVETNHYDDWDY